MTPPAGILEGGPVKRAVKGPATRDRRDHATKTAFAGSAGPILMVASGVPLRDPTRPDATCQNRPGGVGRADSVAWSRRSRSAGDLTAWGSARVLPDGFRAHSKASRSSSEILRRAEVTLTQTPAPGTPEPPPASPSTAQTTPRPGRVGASPHARTASQKGSA